jgi:hypothetical protein
MAVKQVNVPDVSWSYIRRLAYTILVVWVISVRVAGIDPMGLKSLITIAWLMDVLSLAAIWLVVWHFWELRPQAKPA